jgi:vanillate/3-O-methylgallate O-demethylase
MTTTVQLLRTPVEGLIISFWNQPEYTDWIDEQLSWKKTCSLGDWSFLWERTYKGPDARKLLSDISVNDLVNFKVGQAKHIIMCNEGGKVVHEGIVTRHGEDEFMTFGHCSLYAGYKLRTGNYNVDSQEVDWFNFQVAGPNSLYVIEKAAREPLRDIQFMHFRKTQINGREVTVLRQNMAGELGYELVGPRGYGDEIYNAIMEAGREFGIRRIGGRTVMINHLEACFPTVGHDYIQAFFGDDMTGWREEFKKLVPILFTWHNKVTGSFQGRDVSDWYRSPVELGWSKNIKFDHEFIGRKALEKEMARPKRTMVTLVWNARDVIDVYASHFRPEKPGVPMSGPKPYRYMELPDTPQWYMDCDKVLKDGKMVGTTTSRGYSYYFRQMISLCTINVGLRKPGTKVTIIWGNPGQPQKEIRATVAPAPYKEDKRRIDVTKLPSHL